MPFSYPAHSASHSLGSEHDLGGRSDHHRQHSASNRSFQPLIAPSSSIFSLFCRPWVDPVSHLVAAISWRCSAAPPISERESKQAAIRSVRAISKGRCRRFFRHPRAGSDLFRLEERNRFCFDQNRLAIPRIASHVRSASSDRKRAKTAEFHPVAARERRRYSVEDGRHDSFHVLATKVWIRGHNFCNQFGFGQRASCHLVRERCQMDIARSSLTLCEIWLFG